MRMLSPLSTDFSWTHHNLSPVRMVDAFSDFDRIVESFLKPTYARTVQFQPSCDVNEGKDHYMVSFDMPGVNKEDIKIDVQENNLTISGERKSSKEQNDEGMYYRERTYGKFERTFVLPKSIDVDRIEAHYENGVLNVALPKAESAKPRAIPIQTGQDGLFSRLLGPKKEATKELKDVKVS